MAILVWTAIYPTITILLACLGDYFAKITPLPLRTAAITVIAVPLMYIVYCRCYKKLLHAGCTIDL